MMMMKAMRMMMRMERMMMMRRRRQVLKSMSVNLEGINNYVDTDGDDKDDYNLS